MKKCKITSKAQASTRNTLLDSLKGQRKGQKKEKKGVDASQKKQPGWNQYF